MKHIIKTKYKMGDVVIVDLNKSPIKALHESYINQKEVMVIKAGHKEHDPEIYTVVILDELPQDGFHDYIHDIHGEWFESIKEETING